MGEYSTEQDVSASFPALLLVLLVMMMNLSLIKEIRQKPNSVVLFDEIEKAHPSVQKILLEHSLILVR